MTTFALIHGSTHSARAWDLVKAELERSRHAVVTPELPSDEPEASATRYADLIAASVSPIESPVVVAHSAAGWFLPLVAARRRVNRIVFLAAMVPRIGTSFLERMQAEPEMINPAWIGKDPRVKAIADEFLFHDCPSDRLSWAHATIRIVNVRQIMTERYPLQRWPETPGSYIVCAGDRTIRPDWSRNVARSQLKIEPHELPGGHCPYISRPVELAELLLRISEQESQIGHQTRKRI